MKSKIHLNTGFGLVLFGVGSMIIMFTGIEVYSRNMYSYMEVSPDLSFDRAERSLFYWFQILNWKEIYFLILGVVHLVVGVGLVIKTKWANWLGSFLAVITLLTWSYLVFEVFDFDRPRRPEFWLQIGLTVGIFSLLICGLLFLGNEKMKEDLTESHDDFWDEEILDV